MFLSRELVPVAITTISLAIALPAEAITFQLDWTGQTLGYTVEGSFSYDETLVPADGIIRTENLDNFDVAFFTPEGVLIEAFPDNHITTDGFNFNFDTTTGEILQTGLWDTPSGINIGGVRGEDLNFFSVPNPKGDLFTDSTPSPHVHLTDWGEEYPELPVGFTRGARPHLDIAFFTRTQAEVLADPEADNTLGQKLTATQVPEPTTGLLGLGLLSVTFIRRRATKIG
ncbi:MAG: PEP-CTERM sorting domain-containing protein [Cyanobacteria bacterium P01_D01_bin.156]